MKMVKRAYLSLILIGICVLFMFAVFFSSTLSTTSYGTEKTAVQAAMKGSSDAEREHGYCSDSHPIRGASTCPVNGMPNGRP